MSRILKIDEIEPNSLEKINRSKNKIFGNRIAIRRTELNIKQSELAELIDVSDNQISNIENGRSYPKMNNFMLLCDALECNADYLLAGTISNSVPKQIVEMISVLSPEEMKTLWILLDCYLHKKDFTPFDI